MIIGVLKERDLGTLSICTSTLDLYSEALKELKRMLLADSGSSGLGGMRGNCLYGRVVFNGAGERIWNVDKLQYFCMY